MTGGCGRFQLFICATLVMGFSTGGQIVYGLEFLEVYPDYLCRNTTSLSLNYDWFKCDRDFICDNDLPVNDWRIDYDSPDSYHNWVDPNKLNLTCVPKSLIGSIGSVYFFGFAISAGITPYLSD